MDVGNEWMKECMNELMHARNERANALGLDPARAPSHPTVVERVISVRERRVQVRHEPGEETICLPAPTDDRSIAVELPRLARKDGREAAVSVAATERRGQRTANRVGLQTGVQRPAQP